MSLQRQWFGEFSVLRRPSRGEGAVAVHFAHATGFNANTYAPLLESLDPSIDVYAMDARGHGLSEAKANPRRLRSWVRFQRDLQAFVKNLPRPLVLAGHSLGGTVSIQVAARHPSWVAGLVLIDPVLAAPVHGAWMSFARAAGLTAQMPIARAAARRRMGFSSKEAAVENYLGKGAFRTWPRDWIEAYVDGGTVPTDAGTVRLSCDREWARKTFASATTRPFSRVKRLRCPITLIVGDYDGPPLSRAARKTFERMRPEARILQPAGSTHVIPMERPDLIKEEIERMAATVRSEL